MAKRHSPKKSTLRTYRYIIKMQASEHSITDVRRGAVYDLSQLNRDNKEDRETLKTVAKNLSRELRLPVNV